MEQIKGDNKVLLLEAFAKDTGLRLGLDTRREYVWWLEQQLVNKNDLLQRVSGSLLSENRWNFVQKFKESDEYKRLTTELDIEEDRAIITAGKIYDYLTSNDR